MQEDERQRVMNSRSERFVSHALIEVRRFRLLPLFCESAVLLDLSIGGLKMEFTGTVAAKPGQRLWVVIPLAPLGIYAPRKWCANFECRWFDDNRLRIGGIFLGLSQFDQVLIEQIIANLRERGLL